MAVIGTFDTNYYKTRCLRLTLEQLDSDPNERTVKIKWRLTVVGGYSKYYGIGAGYVKLNNREVISWKKDWYVSQKDPGDFPVGPTNSYKEGIEIIQTGTDGNLTINVEMYHGAMSYSSGGVWSAYTTSGAVPIQTIEVIKGEPKIEITSIEKTQADINTNNGKIKFYYTLDPGKNVSSLSEAKFTFNGTVYDIINTTSLEIQNLENGKNYLYNGYAKSIDGDTTREYNLEETKIYIEPKNPVLALGSSPGYTVASHKVTFNLENTVDKNRKLDNYIIEYGTSTDYGKTAIGNVVKELESLVTYYFRIHATDTKDDSIENVADVASMESNYIIPAENGIKTLIAIDNVYVDELFPNKIRLKWLSNGKSYKIFIKETQPSEGTETEIDIPDGTGMTQYDITNLKEDAGYEISLKAFEELNYSGDSIQTVNIEYYTDLADPVISKISNSKIIESGINYFQIKVDLVDTPASDIKYYIAKQDEEYEEGSGLNYANFKIVQGTPGLGEVTTGTYQNFKIKIVLTSRVDRNIGEDYPIRITKELETSVETYIESTQVLGWIKIPSASGSTYKGGLLWVKIPNTGWVQVEKIYHKKNGNWQ